MVMVLLSVLLMGPATATATASPTAPTASPTVSPTVATPTVSPSISPASSDPTLDPTVSPSISPMATSSPTSSPTTSTPTASPTVSPTVATPTVSPSVSPTSSDPTVSPSVSPTSSDPTSSPTTSPATSDPTTSPSVSPTSSDPTASPTTSDPTSSPTGSPTTTDPTTSPSVSPTSSDPTSSPTTSDPTASPTVSPTALISLSTDCEAERQAIQIAVEKLRFFVGEPVTLSGFSSNCTNDPNMFVYSVNDGLVHEAHDTPSFSLVAASTLASGSFDSCVNTRAGDAAITPREITPATSSGSLVELVAKDNTSATAVIARFNMVIRERGTFRLRPGLCGVEQRDSLASYLAGLASSYDVATSENPNTLSAPGFDNTSCSTADIFAEYSENDGGPDVQFKVAVSAVDGDADASNATELARDTLLNADTGKLIMKLPVKGNFTVTITAETMRQGAAVAIPIAQFGIVVADPDTVGRSCEHGKVEDDGVAQNGVVECECDRGYQETADGQNCEEIPPTSASASGAESATATALAASFSGVALIALLVVAALRYQIYRLKHKPVDIGAMQDQLLDAMGLGVTKNIGANEFGCVVEFENDPGMARFLESARAARTQAHPPRVGAAGTTATGRALPSQWQQFQIDLGATLGAALPKLAGALERARISVSSAVGQPPRVLVVIPRQQGQRDDVGEVTAAALHRRANGKRGLVVDAYRVVEVTLACPKRVPREVDRKCLTRLTLLGEGAFGEVYQYQLEEKHKGTPPYFVAAKTIKAKAGADGRDGLLKEAALMALLDHRNVLTLVGVCTVPRNVPALMLMAYCEGGTLEEYVRAYGGGGGGGMAGETGTITLSAISAARRLTICAQVLQGLRYIAARQIVHRDVAARNVLLDSTGTSKIADFGMSVSLAESGKEYMRANEELAVRHAAIEVLTDHKYSVASDVWSFGVLAWEIFSAGAPPYSDRFEHLTEITAFVKEGNTLGSPSVDCPADVFKELMVPCWATDPAVRPGFGALYDVAVLHGAQEDDDALAETAQKRAPSKHRAKVRRAEVGQPPGDRTLLGPSVYHLERVLLPATLAALTPKWYTDLPKHKAEAVLMEAAVENGFLVGRPSPSDPGFGIVVFRGGAIETHPITEHQGGGGGGGGETTVGLSDDGKRFGHVYALIAACLDDGGAAARHFEQPLVELPGFGCTAPAYVWAGLPDTADSANIWQMVHGYAKPQGEAMLCPRDGDLGAAYVDTLEDGPGGAAGHSNALLSYGWSYSVSEVVSALSYWTESAGRDPRHTFIWICSLCLNQHGFVARVAKTGPMSPETLQQEFGERVVAIGRILPMLEPWDDPGYVKRAWCLFELYTAIRKRGECEINVILSPKQRAAFLTTINAAGSDAKAIDGALSAIDSASAECSMPADTAAIHALVRSYAGGFETLNETVRHYLRKWFVSQGGIQVAAHSVPRGSSLPGGGMSTGSRGSTLSNAGGGSAPSTPVQVRKMMSIAEGEDDRADPIGGGHEEAEHEEDEADEEEEEAGREPVPQPQAPAPDAVCDGGVEEDCVGSDGPGNPQFAAALAGGYMLAGSHRAAKQVTAAGNVEGGTDTTAALRDPPAGELAPSAESAGEYISVHMLHQRLSSKLQESPQPDGPIDGPGYAPRASFAEPQYDGMAAIAMSVPPPAHGHSDAALQAGSQQALDRQRSSSYDHAIDRVGLDDDADSDGDRGDGDGLEAGPSSFEEIVYVEDVRTNSLRAVSVKRANPIFECPLPVAKVLVDDYVQDMKRHAPKGDATLRRGMRVRGTATPTATPPQQSSIRTSKPT